MIETAVLLAAPPTPEQQRLGVYILATIVGLMVCGVISVVKELRLEKAERAVNRS